MAILRYIVVDSLGNYLRSFPTYKQAYTYKIFVGGFNYKIIER